MQSPTVVILLGVCSQLLLPHECRQICSQDEFTVKVNGSVVRCLSCAKCHRGLGLFPVCGSDISPTQNIECKPCPPGKFSNTYDSAPCHECHECVTHEVVAVNCTKLSDRNCSGTCQKGYYFDKKALHIHSCQQCSYCCFDGKDVIQEECVTQGLNASNQHCSQRGDKKCAPKPMSVTNPEPTNLSWSSSTTDPPTNHKKNIFSKVFGALGGILLFAALAGTILFRLRKGKRNTDTPTVRPSQPDIVLHVETPSPENHQVNIPGVSIPQNQDVSPTSRLQAPQNEGFASSTEGTPCHTDDELDDLCVVDQRTKRFVKHQHRRKGPGNHQVNTPGVSRPQNQDVSPTSRLQGPQNEGFASSTEGTPCHTDDELDDLCVVDQRTKRFVKRQHSREGAQGGNRRSSLTIIRGLSRGNKAADYQPVPNKDADDSEDSLKILEEGTSELVFRCEVRGKRKITYQWLKDGSTLEGQRSSNLVLHRIKPSDFGCYRCEVRCSDGQNKSEPVKLLSPVSELDVSPRKGMRFKYLTEAFKEHTEIEDTVKILLQKKIPGAGGWKKVAREHKMPDIGIQYLEGSHEAGDGVIEFLKSDKPNLTVYEFCRSLKKVKRNDIVQILSDHLVSVSCHV